MRGILFLSSIGYRIKWHTAAPSFNGFEKFPVISYFNMDYYFPRQESWQKQEQTMEQVTPLRYE